MTLVIALIVAMTVGAFAASYYLTMSFIENGW